MVNSRQIIGLPCFISLLYLDLYVLGDDALLYLDLYVLGDDALIS